MFSFVSAASAPTEIAKPIVIEQTIPEKIDFYAYKYNVSADVMKNVINCESSMNPRAVNHTAIEYSVGLAQINLNVHNVSVEQAMNPDFSIEFMAQNIEKNPHMWSCYSKIYGA